MISFSQAILRTTTAVIAPNLTLQKPIQKGAETWAYFFSKNKDYPKNTQAGE